MPRPSAVTTDESTSSSPILRQRDALLRLAQLDAGDLDAALAEILEADARAMDVGRVSYWQLSRDASRIECAGLFDAARPGIQRGGVLSQHDYPRYFQALLTERAIVATDAWVDPRTSEFAETYFKQHGIRAMLDVPVWNGGRLAGVVCHEHLGSPRLWTQQEQDFAVSIGALVTLAMERAARRHFQQRYDLLARATQDVLWDWNLLTNHITWSPAAELTFGYPRTGIVEDIAWWRERVHPEDAERAVSSLERHVKEGEGCWREEYRFRRGDGSWIFICDRGFVERREDGTPVRMVGSMMDITDLRRLEARLLISDRMASLGTLAAGIAHEINNPLAWIRSNLGYAVDTLESAPEEREEVLTALRESSIGVERVRQIVSDLKTFSRAEDGRLTVQDLRPAIESALSMTLNEIRHRATLVRDFGALPPAQVNEARFAQVMVNLLANAAQAIDQGTVEENRITVRTRTAANGEAIIEVEDTGCGIPPDVLHRVFDPFFTTKPIGEGTGVGLFICHAMVTSFGGTLTVENGEARGCIARIRLPGAKEQRSKPAQPKSAPGPVPRSRILVVDDEPHVCRAVQRVLAAHHDVATATSAQAALDALALQRFDLVLCDVMMPDMNGGDLVSAMRERFADGAPRVVLMTGGAFTPQARAFLDQAALPILEKPFGAEELLAALTPVLQAAR